MKRKRRLEGYVASSQELRLKRLSSCSAMPRISQPRLGNILGAIYHGRRVKKLERALCSLKTWSLTTRTLSGSRREGLDLLAERANPGRLPAISPNLQWGVLSVLPHFW